MRRIRTKLSRARHTRSPIRAAGPIPTGWRNMKGMPVKAALTLAVLWLLSSPLLAQSNDKFPRPEFKNHTEPSNEPTQKQLPRAVVMEWFDVGVLILALSAAAYYS